MHEASDLIMPSALVFFAKCGYQHRVTAGKNQTNALYHAESLDRKR